MGFKCIFKPSRTIITNSTSNLESIEQEQEERQEIIEEKLKAIRALLPELLENLSQIKDPRNPQLIEHKLTMLLLYGILIFVLQVSSRREANRTFTRPQFKKALMTLFPEIECIPHADTLDRVLARINVEAIQQTTVGLVRKLIRNKKFKRYLLEDNRHIIAIDGTRKFSRKRPVSEKNLTCRRGDKVEYYVYVVEANLVFANGLTVPLLSEILEFDKGDIENNKQDCELNAFKRIAKRIKKEFPRLPITLVLDGLMLNGPVMEICHEYNWDYMLVFKDDDLKTVWQEAKALKELSPENQLEMTHAKRNQHFWWVNDIEYTYGNNGCNSVIVHVVVCEESLQEVVDGEVVTKNKRFAWISARPITRNNIHMRCNLIARHRWCIEENILVEKHHGYEYEHCFSENWEAMKGFHYLLRLGHLLNVIAHNTIYLARKVNEYGVQFLLNLVKDTLSGRWLDEERIEEIVQRGRYQLRFI